MSGLLCTRACLWHIFFKMSGQERDSCLFCPLFPSVTFKLPCHHPSLPYSCRVVSCLCMSSLVFSCLVLSCQVFRCRVLSCLVLSCLVLSCLVFSCRVLSSLVWSCRVSSCLVVSFLVFACLVLSCAFRDGWPLSGASLIAWTRTDRGSTPACFVVFCLVLSS